MAYFSAPIRSKIDYDTGMRLYNEGLTDVELSVVFGVNIKTVAFWRRRHKLPPNKPKAEEEPYLTDIKQCENCIYWWRVSQLDTKLRFCQYMLQTGRRRERDGSVCLSQKKKR